MKKMTLTKAKFYAKKIFDLEQKLEDIPQEEKENIELKIVDIVDEICEGYEPTAIYKVDEEVQILAKKSKTKI